MPGPRPVLGPGAAPDVPLQHIVLQQIPVLLGQVGEPGFQIAEHIVIGVVSRHRIQRRRHQGQNGLFQDVRHGGGEHGDAEPWEDALDQVPIGPVVPGHHPDVPKAQATVPGQAQGAGGGPLHLRPGARGPEQLHRPGLGNGPDILVAEQGLFQMFQGVRLCTVIADKVFHLTGNALAGGQPQQPCRREPGGRKDARAPLVLLQVVAGQGHRHLVGLTQQMAQHLLLLGSEVGEAVQPQVLPPGPGAAGQLVRRPGEPVSGVQGRLGHQGLVGPADEPQVGELVPAGALGLLPRPDKLLRAHPAAFQLVHRSQ